MGKEFFAPTAPENIRRREGVSRMNKLLRASWTIMIATGIVGAWVRFDWRAAAIVAICALGGWHLREATEPTKETEDDTK